MLLEKQLNSCIVGQKDATSSIVSALLRAKFSAGKGPLGSFLFCGPTGVGKTEIVKMLARYYVGSENAIVRFDMSEYSDTTSLTKLVGSPLGYVGSGSGSLITGVKSNPQAIVLFDEVEKAHPDVFNIFLQILSDGRLSDSRGSVTSFKDTIVILTSNIGSKQIINPYMY